MTTHWQKYGRAKYLRRRRQCIEILGGKCLSCGATTSLTFHHKNPEEKEFEISKLLNGRWDRLVKELEKCELKCMECHLGYRCFPGLILDQSS